MTMLVAACDRHETVSGYYRTSAYFLAKLVCDVVPQRVFPIVLFAVITYFMIGTLWWNFLFLASFFTFIRKRFPLAGFADVICFRRWMCKKT